MKLSEILGTAHYDIHKFLDEDKMHELLVKHKADSNTFTLPDSGPAIIAIAQGDNDGIVYLCKYRGKLLISDTAFKFRDTEYPDTEEGYDKAIAFLKRWTKDPRLDSIGKWSEDGNSFTRFDEAVGTKNIHDDKLRSFMTVEDLLANFPETTTLDNDVKADTIEIPTEGPAVVVGIPDRRGNYDGNRAMALFALRERPSLPLRIFVAEFYCGDSTANRMDFPDTAEGYEQALTYLKRKVAEIKQERAAHGSGPRTFRAPYRISK